jgi:hypothetical protein
MIGGGGRNFFVSAVFVVTGITATFGLAAAVNFCLNCSKSFGFFFNLIYSSKLL